MATALETVEIRTRRQWRAWLSRHHRTSPGVWLLFHKVHTGVPSLPYDDAVREALCFGWIDSLVKRLDEDRYVRKFTPRSPSSVWSDSNRTRWAELKQEGRLAPAGLAAEPTAARGWPPVEFPVLPAYIAKAFKANRRAWAFFKTLTPAQKRNVVGWIHVAKRPETRERRIREAIGVLEQGRKLG